MARKGRLAKTPQMWTGRTVATIKWFGASALLGIVVSLVGIVMYLAGGAIPKLQTALYEQHEELGQVKEQLKARMQETDALKREVAEREADIKKVRDKSALMDRTLELLGGEKVKVGLQTLNSFINQLEKNPELRDLIAAGNTDCEAINSKVLPAATSFGGHRPWAEWDPMPGAKGAPEQHVYTGTIHFERPFTSKPVVMLGLAGTDIIPEKDGSGLVAKIELVDVRNDSFDIRVLTWSNLQEVRYSWIALGERTRAPKPLAVGLLRSEQTH